MRRIDAAPLLEVADRPTMKEKIAAHPDHKSLWSMLSAARKRGTVTENWADKFLIQVCGLWPYAVYDTI